jgi:hypothetical protein
METVIVTEARAGVVRAGPVGATVGRAMRR